MLATIRSAALSGVHAQPVWVEVHISEGLPGFQIVGLPDTAVRESRERARAAVLSSDLSWPNKRMTVNLAPGDLRKSGSGLELAVACGVLSAAGVFPAGALDGVGVLGELGLDGTVRPVRGAFVLVDALARAGVESVIVPHANATEAALVDSIRVLPVATLGELGRCLKGEDVFTRVRPPELASDDPAIDVAEVGDLADVRGLTVARRALEIAAAGRHHLLLVGPPGAGKTLVAQRFPTICSPLDADEAIDVTRVHSVIGGEPPQALASRRPFRSPHHTCSPLALVGGGSGKLTIGEVTAAHHGTLFLDELGEFAPRALECLRQPLEDRVVRLSRVGTSIEFPANFQLIACTNPCPCGLPPEKCACRPVDRERYLRRLSAPLLDRFDLRCWVEPPAATARAGESSAEVRTRVMTAVARQRARYAHAPWARNAHIPPGALDDLIGATPDAASCWRDEVERLALSGRGAARILRVARTIADLADSAAVDTAHVLEAALLREDVP
ncbi:MAG: YifB family Mg chelatase-like AAA ATPase [Acidimicrobiia bacterium]